MVNPATTVVNRELESGDSDPSARPDIPDPPPSRWKLSLRAHTLRSLAQIGFSLQNKYNGAPNPNRTVWIDSTLSARDAGAQVIRLDVYDPRGNIKGGDGVPMVVNFHGGGYTLGHGTDDALWAKAVMEQLGAVVVSVSYRLAPSYPFPTPIEDSVDAILWTHAHAADLGVDPSRMILSGFSSGANIALSAHLILSHLDRWGYTTPTALPTIIGLIPFYPTLDWTIARWIKRKRSLRPALALSTNITDLTDASHLYPDPDTYRTDPRLSPGIAPDEMLRLLPPVHLCLCEYDMLLQEGQDFAGRLEQLGVRHTVRVVEGEKHAFDKPPPMSLKDVAVDEYKAAIESAKRWLDELE